MKKVLLIIFLTTLHSSIIALGANFHGSPAGEAYADGTVPQVDNSMTGYATVSGEGYATTTGGQGGAVITISTLAELQAWAASRENNTSPEVVHISGRIESSASTVVTIKHGANVSVLGVGSTAELKNVGLNFRNYKNIIVRNLKIHEVFYPNDGLTIDQCQHVWVDHNEFHSIIGPGIGVDTYDGLLDIKNGSRYVTVSWNYFHDHMKTILIGHTDNSSAEVIDREIRVTFHHNYFENTDGRNPSLRWGAVHMYNNYLKNIFDYGIAIRQGAHALLEHNVYENVKLPISTNKFTGEGYACERGNLFSGTSGANSITQTDCDWWNSTTLPYAYTLDPVTDLTTTVPAHVGVGKVNVTGGGTTPGVTFKLVTSVIGQGAVTPSEGTFNEGETATLTATPASGWKFDNWGGDASGASATTTVTLNSNKSVTATFSLIEGGGPPTGSNVFIAATATPETGLCSFDGVLRTTNDGGSVINLSNTAGKGVNWKVMVPTAGTYELKWRYAGGGSSALETGKLMLNGTIVNENISFPKPKDSQTYLTTAPHTVTLGAGVNEIRIEVYGAFADIGSLEVTGDSPQAVDCSKEIGTGGTGEEEPEPVTYALTASTNGEGSVDPANDTFEQGVPVTLTATPAQGWKFDYWSGDASGTTNSVTITMDANKSVTANFSRIAYKFAVVVEGEGSVSFADRIYYAGETAVITALAASGHEFSGWSGDAGGATNPLTITIDGNKSVTAKFSKIGNKGGNSSSGGVVLVYPNPMKGATTFEISLVKKARVKVSILNSDGSLMQVVTNQSYNAGVNRIPYVNDSLKPGLYFYVVEIDKEVIRDKLMAE